MTSTILFYYAYDYDLFSNHYTIVVHMKRIKKMDIVAQLCPFLFASCGGDDTTITDDITLYESIKQISPDQLAVVPISFWYSTGEWAKFEPIYTQEGLCFTANSINSHELYTNVSVLGQFIQIRAKN